MASYKHSARRSLRLRLLVLLLVPLLSLAALWAFAAYLTTRDALGKYQASTTYQKIALPGGALTATLEQERLAAAVLVTTGQRDRRGYTAARAATDTTQVVFRRSVLSDSARGTMSETTRQRLDQLLAQLDALGAVRAQVEAGTVDALGAINDYSTVIESLEHLFGSLVLINDPGIYQQGTAIISVTRAHEFLMRENALVTAAMARRTHRLTGPEALLFARSVATGRYLFDAGLGNMKPSLRGPLDRLAASSDFNTFRGLEDSIAAGGARHSLAPEEQTWRSTTTPLMASWGQAVAGAGRILTAEAKPIGDRITAMVYAAAGFGLLAVALSIVVSVLFGRNLARELSSLQRAALELAGERLPSVIRRLRAGEKVDVDAEAPPITVGRSREVARVAEALTTLQRTAIQSAVGETRLRQGINQVFLNLAWRSQSLLHRQLSMLDAMEKEASDPDALEDLFALDHLTTRMRRHAEGLVILSGSAPARGWHNPVAVRDILRGAIGEVEDYTRVVVDAASPAALDGSVVADVTHLLAELIENATAFSPPPTQVHVRGERTADGYRVEIEDRGIGMNEAEFADANQRLEHPPEFDLADSDRLGLFIVGRLAERRGIDVRLTASPYGGARAVVGIPLDFIARDDGPDLERTWSDESAAPEWQPLEPRRPTGPAGVLGPGTGVPGTGFGPPARGTRPPASAPGVRGDAPAADRPDHIDPGAPELPRRVRQASLAPQLRRELPAPEPVGLEPATTRAPEETRSLMASLQQGWQRGREEEDPDE